MIRFKYATVACCFDPKTSQRVSHFVAIDDKGRILERISGMPPGEWSVVPVTEVRDETEDRRAKPSK